VIRVRHSTTDNAPINNQQQPTPTLANAARKHRPYQPSGGLQQDDDPDGFVVSGQEAARADRLSVAQVAGYLRNNNIIILT
jgi:hypothetical protein